MSAHDPGLSHHPAPHADRLSGGRAAILIFGGPAAWFLQLCIGVALTSRNCFPRSERFWTPLADPGAHVWAVGVMLAFVVLALGVGFAAQRTLRHVAREEEGDHADLAEIGHGRTRFVALWGVALGYGSAIAAALTFVAFLLVPPCAG